VSTGATQYTAVWGFNVSAAAGPAQHTTVTWWSVAGIDYQIKLMAATR
jgi:hypothetical protein